MTIIYVTNKFMTDILVLNLWQQMKSIELGRYVGILFELLKVYRL